MEDSPAPEIEASRLVLLGIWFYGAMAVVAVVWRVGIYGEPIWWLGDPPEAVPWVRDLGLGLAVAAAVIALSYALTEATGWGEKLAGLYNDAMFDEDDKEQQFLEEERALLASRLEAL